MTIFSNIADVIAGSYTDTSLPKPPLIGLGAPALPLEAAIGLATAARTELSRQPIPPQQLNEILANLAKERGGAFNWSESIVDLMKLLHLESDLEAIQRLGQKLGYPGPKDGSPEMTDWLHAEVMARLTGAFDRPSENASPTPAAV
jgi:hypothetical protein